MAILKIAGDDNRQLQNVANILASSKKVVVFTGAGISTNCGIPVGRQTVQSPVIRKLTFRRISARRKVSTLLSKPAMTGLRSSHLSLVHRRAIQFP